MNNYFINAKENILHFLKKYGYIVALSLIVLSVAITVALVGNKPTHKEEFVPVDNKPVGFYTPVLNATVLKEYNDKSLIYNETLNQWEAHKSIDFKVAENSDVFAVLDGTVVDVKTNYLMGTQVIIKHNKNIKTVYSSLSENVKVKKGDYVKRGQVIGKASNSANADTKIGTHLRFQVLNNDSYVNPMDYLNLKDK